MSELTTAYMTQNSERHIPNPAIQKWNQSFYFNFYDRKTKAGAFIRVGILENLGQTNGFTIFFRDGKPLFTRVNMNLPYTSQRPDPGMEVAGLRMQVTKPLQTTRIILETEDFAADLTWDLRFPMADSIALTKDGGDAIAQELCYVHLEGFCDVRGHLRLRNGETIEVNDSGFRDVSVGPRNWSGVLTQEDIDFVFLESNLAFDVRDGCRDRPQCEFCPRDFKF